MEKKERRGELIIAINRTGTQPMDSSRVTFAQEKGGEETERGEAEREREREREREETTSTSTMLLS